MPTEVPIITADGRVLDAPRPARLADEVWPGLWLGGSWGPYSDTFDAVHHRTCSADGPVLPADLAQVVRRVLAEVRAGRKTLVCCALGLNRSALVVAEVLWRLDPGRNGNMVIKRLRDVRSPYVLCNSRFEQHVRRLR